MKNANVINLSALLIALSSSILFSGIFTECSSANKNQAISQTDKTIEDATGKKVRIQKYKRIASGSMVVDRLLLELANPESILAYSGFTQNAPWAYRMGSKPHLDSLQDVEKLITLKPDLFVVHHSMSIQELKRLRESGMTMFDLGPYGEFEDLLEDIRVFSTLIGHPKRGEKLARALTHRMQAVEKKAHQKLKPRNKKPSAIYLTHYGKDLYGSTRGSSIHDVIEYAGLHDIAANSFSGWPRFTAEQLLEMNPDYILTHQGMKKPICNVPGLDNLLACKEPKRIIEMEATTLTSPGPSMVTATEILFEKVEKFSK